MSTTTNIHNIKRINSFSIMEHKHKSLSLRIEFECGVTQKYYEHIVLFAESERAIKQLNALYGVLCVSE